MIVRENSGRKKHDCPAHVKYLLNDAGVPEDDFNSFWTWFQNKRVAPTLDNALERFEDAMENQKYKSASEPRLEKIRLSGKRDMLMDFLKKQYQLYCDLFPER